jgi:hypothetical protein
MTDPTDDIQEEWDAWGRTLQGQATELTVAASNFGHLLLAEFTRLIENPLARLAPRRDKSAPPDP